MIIRAFLTVSIHVCDFIKSTFTLIILCWKLLYSFTWWSITICRQALQLFFIWIVIIFTLFTCSIWIDDFSVLKLTLFGFLASEPYQIWYCVLWTYFTFSSFYICKFSLIFIAFDIYALKTLRTFTLNLHLSIWTSRT